MGVVIFDLDGTLVDTVPDLQGAVNAMLAARGYPALSSDQIRSFVGNGVPEMVRRTMARVAAPEAEFAQWHDDFTARYEAAVCDLSHPYPGVIEALDILAAAGHRLGICTNKPQGLAEDLLEALDLAERFGAVLGGDTEFGRKPAPEGLIEVRHRLGGGPAVMVGDTIADTQAARAAGLPVLFFSEGYRDRAVEQIAPDAHFSDWAMLPDLVAAHLG